MEGSLDEQQREIKDFVRRAKGNPDRTGTFRRGTLRRLIDLIHSRHSSLKILAAGDIKYFFKDFPDLEEAAINAIYDLCEDQDSEVRMAGYSAITQVSKDRPNWVKRNADVLVQLLQSDEPDEVIIVKKALVEHLDMDCCVTLGVLCDQFVFSEEPADEEEQFIRDRLRSLVLSFITTEAKRALVRHASQPNSGAEDVLVNALWVAIPKLTSKDLITVVKGILVALPSYKNPNSPRGNDLLQLLLARANASFRTEFRPGDHASFKNTRFFLDLAKFVVLDEKISSAVDLLQFYCTSLIGKMTLVKLSGDDSLSVISDTAKILTACDNEHSSAKLPPLQRQIVDACPILLERILDSKTARMGSWSACKALLQACSRRKEESNWTIPTPLSNILCEISALSEPEGEREEYQGVQDLIRSLVPPNIKLGIQHPAVRATDILPGRANSRISEGTGKQQGSHPLPPRPSGASQAAALDSRQRDVKSTISIIGAHSAQSSSKRSTDVDGSPRPPKKTKQGDGRDIDIGGPSLLSRMGSSTPTPNGSHAHAQGNSERGVATRVRLSSERDEYDKRPEGGFSILGAAKAQRVVETTPLPMTSLLDRIKISSEDDQTRKRRRRGGRAHR